jgi:aspartate/methionine/tyrosine aminotransferase
MEYQGPSLPSEPRKLDDTIAVWAEMNELAKKYKCLSLGEGAPGYHPPDFLKQNLMKAIDSGFN